MSLEDEQATFQLIQKVRPDRVYHFAGISRVSKEFSSQQYLTTNYMATLHLIKALERLAKPVSFFFASSVHVYGNPQEIVTETSPPHPQGPYGQSKYLAEEALRNQSTKNDQLKAIIGRLYNCIGPGQAEGFVASDLCRKIATLKRTQGTLLETGPLNTYRRFLDVRDAVSLIPQLFNIPTASQFEIYNIASEREVQIKEMVNILIKYAGISPKVESSGEASPNEFKGLRLSTDKLKKAIPGLGFRPIEETLKDMLDRAMSMSN